MNGANKKILIIDNDDRNIFALTATLRSKGFACALQGLEFMEEYTLIDAVLMDMMMPELDGYEAIPMMREIPYRKETPVFAVTAQAMKGDRKKCLETGANDYISKRIDVDRLLFLLSTAVV